MPRPAKITLSCLLALTAWAGLIWATNTIHTQRVFGAIYDTTDLTPTVDVGDTISIAVHDNGPVAYSWSASVSPEGTLTQIADRIVRTGFRLPGAEIPAGCCGGTRYYTFTAAAKGSAKVRLDYCNGRQDCDRPLIWAVTVR